MAGSATFNAALICPSRRLWRRLPTAMPSAWVGALRYPTAQQPSFGTLLRFDPNFGSDVDPLVIISAQRITVVSEPSTLTLLALGAVGLAVMRRQL